MISCSGSTGGRWLLPPLTASDFGIGKFRGYRSPPPRFTVAVIAGLMSVAGVVVMNKDRIAGAVKEAKGSVKETIGKVLGDAKMQSDGKTEKVVGKVQNAIGGLKDALKE
jgi:uncharacterized protein YjbJ (UPF0337 family)